jgi:hypothetical protein
MMKGFIITAIALMGLTACNNAGSDKANDNTDSASSVQANTATPNAGGESSVSDVVAKYLDLKNALAADNGNDAASAGKELLSALGRIDSSGITEAQKKTLADAGTDAREHAEHISQNGANIAHQREHFAMLSQDVYDLTKAFGSGGQTLYKDYCPMYNDKKGAYWDSEMKDIKNPYLGKEMPTCGEVKEEIK